MILTVPWIQHPDGPRPDLPERAGFSVLEDLGEAVRVRVNGSPQVLEAARVRALPMRQRIAARRWEAEVSGTTFGEHDVRTDRESHAMLTGALVMLSGAPGRTVRWKFVSTWAELDAGGLAQVAGAVMAHVEACFEREEQLVAAWDAGEPVNMEEGWP